jgi:hypothetical protein
MKRLKIETAFKEVSELMNRLRTSCATAEEGAGIRNEEKHRRGALSIAQQRVAFRSDLQ